MTCANDTQQIADVLLKKLPEECNLYLYGSRVYGTHDENSDHDFIVIHQDQLSDEDYDSILKAVISIRETDGIDVQLYSHVSAFDNLCKHAPSLVEIKHLPQEFKFRESFDFSEWASTAWYLRKEILRKSFSQVASNSWVKAKKKLTVEADYDERVARKSLFHSFRLLDLAIQIAEGYTTPDFSASNKILEEINSLPSNWDLWDATFRSRHNILQTKFRTVCPK